MNGIEANKQPLITFFCIATNGYIKYAKNLLESLDNLSSPAEVQIILLSDTEISSFQTQNIIVTNVEITSLSWPWATLMRYHLITNHIDLAMSENICYIDADSVVHEPFWKTQIFESAQSGLIFVQHPGYFRGIPAKNFFGRIRDLVKDFKLLTLEGGLGNWEKRKISSAYVDRRRRNIYICGGVWMGKLNSIKTMSRKLQENVDLDLADNLIARWHDESHLNQYYVNSNAHLVGPEFCFARNRANLRGRNMIIEAIDK